MSKKNSQEKKSEVSAIVTKLLALVAIFEKVTLSPLVESVVLGILNMVESFASDSKVAPFIVPERGEGEDIMVYAQRIVTAKADYDSKSGDERKRVKSSLVDGFAAIVEENALSGKGIDPAVKARAEQMLKDGKPASAISTETGVSLPTLANWKKALGLTKSRS